MSEIVFQRLHPPEGAVDARALVAHLRAGEPRADRPYTVANFVMSASGQASVDGRSAPLSNAGDRALFHALRAEVDAILAGTGTLADERYGRPIPRAETRQARRQRGLRPEPLAVTLARSGAVATDIPLFACAEVEAVVFSPSAPPPTAARVHHEPYEDAAAAMRTLRERHGVELLLCEGGPRLFTALAAADLIDELFLTLAPQLTPADAPAIVAGEALDTPRHLSLRSASVLDGSLFLNYVRRDEKD